MIENIKSISKTEIINLAYVHPSIKSIFYNEKGKYFIIKLNNVNRSDMSQINKIFDYSTSIKNNKFKKTLNIFTLLLVLYIFYRKHLNHKGNEFV